MEPMFSKAKRNHHKNRKHNSDSFARKAKANWKRLKKATQNKSDRYSDDE